MNPAGRVRCNMVPIVRDYSRASQCFLFAHLTRVRHDFEPPDAGVRRVSGIDRLVMSKLRPLKIDQRRKQ